MSSPPNNLSLRRRFSLDSSIGSCGLHPTSAMAMALEPPLLSKRPSLSDIYRPSLASPTAAIPIPRSIPSGETSPSGSLSEGGSLGTSPIFVDPQALSRLRQMYPLQANLTGQVESAPDSVAQPTTSKSTRRGEPLEEDRMKKKMMTAQFIDF